jgi:hypothetical protein
MRLQQCIATEMRDLLLGWLVYRNNNKKTIHNFSLYPIPLVGLLIMNLKRLNAKIIRIKFKG